MCGFYYLRTDSQPWTFDFGPGPAMLISNLLNFGGDNYAILITSIIIRSGRFCAGNMTRGEETNKKFW